MILTRIECGGIKTLLKALSMHPQYSHLQYEGCGALGTLAKYNDENSIDISKCGCIKLIIAAMTTDADDVSIQYIGSASLKKLTMNDDNKVKIANAGGIQFIAKAMTQHIDIPHVQRYGCKAM